MKVFTDITLAEFNGDLREVTVALDRIIKGFTPSLPEPEDLWWESQEAIDYYLSRVEFLNSCAPEGYYFGAHELQPTCLGYWKNGI